MLFFNFLKEIEIKSVLYILKELLFNLLFLLFKLIYVECSIVMLIQDIGIPCF